MRLPIVQFPNIVVENLASFASVFSTDEQKKHFCEYVTGLIVGDKATIKGTSNFHAEKCNRPYRPLEMRSQKCDTR